MARDHEEIRTAAAVRRTATSFWKWRSHTTDFSQWTTLRNSAEQAGLKRTLIEREVYFPDGVELQEGVE